MSLTLSEQLKREQLSYPQTLLHHLQKLRHFVTVEGEEKLQQWKNLIEKDNFKPSTRNLAYYLALRQEDIRHLQLALMPWGLSSLGRIESKVLPTLDAVIATLGAVCHQESSLLPKHPPLEAFFQGDQLLASHSAEVFGLPSPQRRVRIMVTMPTEAATDPDFIAQLLRCGMDCIRINCAHDGPKEWQEMIENLREAVKNPENLVNGHTCKVYMDLAGPKIRLEQILAPQSQTRLYQGDFLLLTTQPPHTAHPQYFQANCSQPEIIPQIPVGAKVWIDDGHIGAEVIAIMPEGLLLKITHAREKGEKLKADKGLNFPDTVLNIDPLTAKDRQDLDFIAENADIIGYSFVQKASDIETLQLELQSRLGDAWRQKAIVAKIETPLAVKNLPELIIHAAGKQPFGVMIARGDLAVEIGYQRLAEIQEEILWLCEAAHIPVIWATQVLENLVKKSIPSRAEITDAAMAERAECVMLNKGEYIREAVTILDDVLQRMQTHQAKKTPQLRALHSWV
ncbi:pyruvate kinase [Microcystis sp. BLCC-F210]|uniref:pyruvate kinase n=1 Tax=Microcystis sp. BLCC-F210 TaxID=3342751 RepID=UPI0035C8DF8B